MIAFETYRRHDGLALAELVRRGAETRDRRRWLTQLTPYAAAQVEPRARGILLGCCAWIAEPEQFAELLGIIGAPVAGEDTGLNTARQIIARRSGPLPRSSRANATRSWPNEF